MKLTHPKGRIIQFHHNSPCAKELLDEKDNAKYKVLQIEPVEHEKYDFIAEIVKKDGDK
jgi:hypothetical protein